MHKLLMSIAQELLSARKHNSHHVKGWEKYFIFICNNSCFALSIVNIEPKKKNALLKDVAKFYEKLHELGKPFTVRHFVSMGVPRRACYYVLRKFEASGRFSEERKRGSGRKTVKMSGLVKRRLVQKASYKIGVSTRKLAKEFGISHAYERQILKKKLG